MQYRLMTWTSGTKGVREQRRGTWSLADLDTWRRAGNNHTGQHNTGGSSPVWDGLNDNLVLQLGGLSHFPSVQSFSLKWSLAGDLSPAFISLILRWSQMTSVQSKTEKWESGSVASSNSSHFDFSSNADEVFSQIGLPESVAAAEFITLWSGGNISSSNGKINILTFDCRQIFQQQNLLSYFSF